jgi:hypothetical protein
MRRLILLPLLALLLFAQVVPVTPTKITGDGSTHPFTATSTAARSFLFQCPSTNSATIWIGDSTVTTSGGSGWACPAGGAISSSVLTGDSRGSASQYVTDLSKWYYAAGSGDVINWGYTK